MFCICLVPSKEAPRETRFLKSIAQTREIDLFAILHLPNHEHSLFLNFLRSCIVQGPVRSQKQDQSFEQGNFNRKTCDPVQPGKKVGIRLKGLRMTLRDTGANTKSSDSLWIVGDGGVVNK